MDDEAGGAHGGGGPQVLGQAGARPGVDLGIGGAQVDQVRRMAHDPADDGLAGHASPKATDRSALASG